MSEATTISGFFPPLPGAVRHLDGEDRREAERTVQRHHYTHSVPSGKSHWFAFEQALVCFSLPANCNADLAVLGKKGNVWELTRLWAPDGHPPNLLTRAVAAAVRLFARLEKADALVSYADPNVGHEGGVYRAASWVYQGQSEEQRLYQDKDGRTFARRKFHSGNRSLTHAQIAAKGFTVAKGQGKHRFAKGLSRWARKAVARRGYKEVTMERKRLRDRDGEATRDNGRDPAPPFTNDVDTGYYENRLRINKHDLDEELVEQPATYHDVADRLAAAREARDRAKDALKTREAELAISYRHQKDDAGEKCTEAQLAQLVQTNPLRQKAFYASLDAEREVGRWEALKDAYRDRGFALRELVALHLSAYFQNASVSSGDILRKEADAAQARAAMAAQRKARE